MSHGSPPKLSAIIFAVLVVVAATPTLIVLLQTALPLVVVLAVAVIAGRLVFFHTRRW